tara:strand:- start:1663 stop:1770 length:108 start_codon:yes stop_codon:yes gene_type:complete
MNIEMYGTIRAVFNILKAKIAKDRAGTTDRFCSEY